MGKRKNLKIGTKPNDVYLGEDLDHMSAKDAAHIKRSLRKAAKKVKKKHIYFNDEWNNKDQ